MFQRPHFRSVTYLLMSLGIPLLLGGCSWRDDRQRVTGVVTVNGAPLELGTVSFMPEEGRSANSFGATVRDGRFELPAARGLRPGRYTVRVLAYRDTGRPYEHPHDGDFPEYEELRFRETDLDVVVDEDGPNHFEFALTLAP